MRQAALEGIVRADVALGEDLHRAVLGLDGHLDQVGDKAVVDALQRDDGCAAEQHRERRDDRAPLVAAEVA